MRRSRVRRKTNAAVLVAAFTVATLLATSPVDAKKRKGKSKDLPQVTHDGLELVAGSKADAAWISPGVDFSVYDRIQILDCYVAFKKGWSADHNRSSVNRITNRDVERMKTDMAELFREVFVGVLDSEGGYPVVDEPDTDVLLLRPGIIDLDVTAPDVAAAGRSYSFAASAGSATLYLELYDSVSGEILGRVIDRQSASDHGGVMRWTNQVANRMAAQQVLGDWAELLRQRLDEIHGR